jgi:hypothetical protein
MAEGLGCLTWKNKIAQMEYIYDDAMHGLVGMSWIDGKQGQF